MGTSAAFNTCAGNGGSPISVTAIAVNMGPIVVRGMWYPFVAVGVPKWADA
jgi:hypothetical protein